MVGAIEPNVRRAEIERAFRKRPESLDAYDLYLRALPRMGAHSPAESIKALGLIEAALEDWNAARADLERKLAVATTALEEADERHRSAAAR